MSFFQGHFHDKLIMERQVLIFGVLMFLTFTVKNYAGKHFPLSPCEIYSVKVTVNSIS